MIFSLISTYNKMSTNSFKYKHTWQAAEKGDFEELKKMYENGFEWDSKTTVWSAGSGSIDCLRYAHENGCKWNKDTTFWAAANGKLECLRYAHENGCEWDEQTTLFAANGWHYDCFRYAIINGCPFDIEVIKMINRSIQRQFFSDNTCRFTDEELQEMNNVIQLKQDKDNDILLSKFHDCKSWTPNVNLVKKQEEKNQVEKTKRRKGG